MSWRIAESLEILRKQLNEMFPSRSKVSDGGIGDAKHASRNSDHNPWVKDKNGVGIVTARDFTFDNNPADGVGIDCHALAEVLVKSRDPRIKYIIWNNRIISSNQQPWVWRKYTGQNPHKHHLHLSVMADEFLFDDSQKWDLTGLSSAIEVKPNLDTDDLLEIGDAGAAVVTLQQQLVKLNLMRQHEVDGDFGKITKNAVIAFQRLNDLTADGIVGAGTRARLQGKTD